MKGFMSANRAYEADENGRLQFSIEALIKKNIAMQKAGFIIDKENAIYVMEGFGAFSSNVHESIKTIDDLRNFIDKNLGKNPYTEIVRLMDEEGYEFVLGPGSSNGGGVLGLYCKNYKEIIKQQKLAKQKEDEGR